MISAKNIIYNTLKIFLILNLFLLLSCSNSLSSTNLTLDKNKIKNKILFPGITNQSVSFGNSNTLLYSLSVPKINENEKVPFVIALHFAGKMTPHFSEDYLRYLVEPGLRMINPIIFAPDAPNGVWNDNISEEMIIQFLEAALEFWPIDSEKIIITGYSNGGIGTWLLIDKYPNKFSAAIPMASLNTSELRGKVPTYIIHGKKDELFNWEEIQKVYEYLNDKGTNVRISINSQLSHYEAHNYVPELQKTVDWLINDVWAKEK